MNAMEKIELGVVDKDIADAFMDTIKTRVNGDYDTEQPTRIQIARSLKELNLNLRTLINALQKTDTFIISAMDSESIDRALRKGGAKAIQDIAKAAVARAINRKDPIMQGYANTENKKIDLAKLKLDISQVKKEMVSLNQRISDRGVMLDHETRKAQATEIYNAGLKKVENNPEPKRQKFPCGTRVQIAKDLGSSMSHFISGAKGTVEFTYAHAFGGTNVEEYSIDVDGFGSHAWYKEWQLTEI